MRFLFLCDLLLVVRIDVQYTLQYTLLNITARGVRDSFCGDKAQMANDISAVSTPWWQPATRTKSKYI